ncbi:MAG TPA: nucleotide exchange factor GrpE, partial [Thermoanaerobaculia bacterium]|nr:nucleotide exchange factor GrpE [Thermoanaerobaculia bacterium]
HERELSALLLALLEVMDSFDRLLGPPAEPAAKPRIEPATLARIAAQLEGALAGAGLESLACQGLPVDPHQHEIVDLAPAVAGAPETIVSVVRRGWLWRGKPLRRPRVVVAAKTAEESSE